VAVPDLRLVRSTPRRRMKETGFDLPRPDPRSSRRVRDCWRGSRKRTGLWSRRAMSLGKMLRRKRSNW
jgi:hypothetical protein